MAANGEDEAPLELVDPADLDLGGEIFGIHAPPGPLGDPMNGALLDFFADVLLGRLADVIRRLHNDPRLLVATGIRGETGLIKAAAFGHMAIVRALVEMGADVAASSHPDGLTALRQAAANGHAEVVTFLLEHGADPTTRDSSGNTVLMAAVCRSHADVVKALLPHTDEETIDARDGEGDTAVGVACLLGQAQLVKLLLLAGADHRLANHDGLTPMQIARDRKKHLCVQLLEWWEDEQHRAYELHRAMRLHELTGFQNAGVPPSRVPEFIAPRVDMGLDLPRVVVVGTAEETQRTRTRAYVRDEETRCIVKYVVQDMAPELVVELLAGFHHVKS